MTDTLINALNERVTDIWYNRIGQQQKRKKKSPSIWNSLWCVCGSGVSNYMMLMVIEYTANRKHTLYHDSTATNREGRRMEAKINSKF